MNSGHSTANENRRFKVGGQIRQRRLYGYFSNFAGTVITFGGAGDVTGSMGSYVLAERSGLKTIRPQEEKTSLCLASSNEKE